MHRDEKCGRCGGQFRNGERIAMFRDDAGQVFRIHKRCIKRLKLTWHPIPTLPWIKTHASRWAVTSNGDEYAILSQRIGGKLVFGCILNDKTVFATADSLPSAKAKAEQEANEKNLKNTK